ncbi:MAG: hypothetical protein RLZZ230_207 [Candidatus Parcubacteria bacterium]|jgi:antitoxin MazE
MKTSIQKWGNSLAVRLPKNITEQKSIKEGSGVNVMIKDNQIVIELVQEEVSLKSMLSNISAANLHGESKWSSAQGNEVW